LGKVAKRLMRLFFEEENSHCAARP
jgi:hypothetical protein